MAEADEYGPGGHHADGPNAEPDGGPVTTRCPECDFTLMKTPARNVTMVVTALAYEKKLLSVDLIYCDRCGWWRGATAQDLDVLDVLKRPGG